MNGCAKNGCGNITTMTTTTTMVGDNGDNDDYDDDNNAHTDRCDDYTCGH